MKYSYVLIVMTYLYACDKPNLDVQNVKAGISHIQKTQITSNNVEPANPRNPYDYYGALHNEGMDYVRLRMKVAGETKPEAVSKYVQEFASVKTGQTDTNDYYSLYQRLMKDSTNFYAILVERASLSPIGKQYLLLIFQVITRRISQQTFICSDVKSEILEIETRILNDRSLPTYDYSELLKAASLARYSSSYWSQNPPKSKSIFGTVFAVVAGICSDLSALDPLCGSFLNWMSGGDFDPIAISSIMYYAM